MSALSFLDALNPLVLVSGHYGAGKTTFVLNLARCAARSGRAVTVVDLDVVNPYFRSSDYEGLLQAEGIETVKPLFAGTSLDNPGLSARIEGVLDELAYCGKDLGGVPQDEDPDSPVPSNTVSQPQAARRLVIIDVGGDDVGATALGRYAERINALPHDMLYVVNYYRNLTQTAPEAIDIMREIEAKSHIRITALIDNAHMRRETTWELLDRSLPLARDVAAQTGLPLLAKTVPNWLVNCPDGGNAQIVEEHCAYYKRLYVYGVFPTELLVTTPWE